MNLHEILEQESRKAAEGHKDPPAPPEPPTIYRHRYLAGMTCIKLAPTKRGWKTQVTATNGKKSKTIVQFYDTSHFDTDNGIWQQITNP